VGGSDPVPLEEAERAGEVIVTHDLDYGTVLAFTGKAGPSVIILRLRDVDPEWMLRQIVRAWPQIAPALQRGAIAVLEDCSARIRELPVSGAG
jgi:predicted nuclease of predicted toxin-antitoxin system